MSSSFNSTLKNTKTININEDLFKYSNHSKTAKKDRKPIVPSIVKPNSLKKQLINRIREHKIKENLNKSNIQDNQTQYQHQEKDTFNDEFNDSINYLTSLSKKVKQDYEKKNYEKKLANKTLKNPYSSISNPYVELELPDELLITGTSIVPINKGDKGDKSNEYNVEYNVEYKIDNLIPYGCLKNGKKPTYKNWSQQTKKNYPSLMTSQPTNENKLHSHNLNNQRQSKLLSNRENKLELLKQKIKQQNNQLYQSLESPPFQPPPPTSLPSLQMDNDTLANSLYVQKENIHSSCSSSSSFPNKTETFSHNNMNTIMDKKHNNKIAANKYNNFQIVKEKKKKTKKKTKKKYTLGKSKIHKKVGVFIKNNETRKKIIDAHKDLKKKPLNEVKKYLKEHGLLKVGSDAPSDVLRKMYESAYLTGDVVNYDKDIIIHNFLNDNS